MTTTTKRSSTTTRRTVSPEQRAERDAARQEKLAALHEQIVTGVLTSSGAWEAMLRTTAKFHHHRTGSVGIFEVRECCGSAP